MLRGGRGGSCVARRLKTGQFPESRTPGIFFAGGIMPGNNIGRAFTADNAKPQVVFPAFVWCDPGVVGGASNLHTTTSLYRSRVCLSPLLKWTEHVGAGHKRSCRQIDAATKASLAALAKSCTAGRRHSILEMPLISGWNVKNMLKKSRSRFGSAHGEHYFACGFPLAHEFQCARNIFKIKPL